MATPQIVTNVSQEKMTKDDSQTSLSLQRTSFFKMNSSIPDLRILSKDTASPSFVTESNSRITNPNHFSLITGVESGKPIRDEYEYSLLIEWTTEYSPGRTCTELIESQSVTCSLSSTIWKLRLQPTDLCGQLSANSAPAANIEDHQQQCVTLYVIAIDLFQLNSVLGYFAVEWQDEGIRREMESGGAVWRKGDSKGHVLQVVKSSSTKQHVLSLKVRLFFTKLDLERLLSQVEPPKWSSISVANGIGQPNREHKVFCLAIHWKIKNWSSLTNEAPGVMVIRSRCFGLKNEEILFRLIMYPGGSVLDSEGTVRSAVHLMHLPQKLRSSGLRMQFAIAIRLNTGQRVSTAGAEVRRADRIFYEGAGWSIRFGHRDDMQNTSDCNVTSREFLSCRAELRFRVPCDN